MNNSVTISYSSLIHMILSANGFKHIFDTNYKEMLTNIINPPVVISNYDIFAATTSNAFLAIELYLKFIEALFYWHYNQALQPNPEDKTEYTGGHDVKALYDKVMFYREVSTKLPDYVNDLSDVATFLDGNKNGFIEWRYFFEHYSKTETNFVILSNFLNGLEDYTHYLLDTKYKPDPSWTENLPNLSGTVFSKPARTIEEAESLLKTQLKYLIDP